MIRPLIISLLCATPALAQGHDHHHAAPTVAPSAPVQADPHAGHAMPAMAKPSVGTLDAGTAPPPAPPADHYADRSFDPAEMAAARARLRREHGGETFWQIQFDLAEIQIRQGREGYRWDGEGWIGGDIDRLVIKAEGEGEFGGALGEMELQALWSRAIGPYFNLQAGIRHDIRPRPQRSYAVIGVEGLAPYWFEVEGALFLSDRGDLTGRIEGYYDQQIDQSFVLRPSVELNFAAQDVPRQDIAAGFTDLDLGLRLRYEITPRFAPYVGVNWERQLGGSARIARAAGEDVSTTNAMIGLSAWF